MKMIDLTGKRFASVQVVKFSHAATRPSGKRIYLWECVCDCGKTCALEASGLRRGNTKSCGCARRTCQITHGLTGHYIYATWCEIIRRCENKNSRGYQYYGSRGIKMCPKWRESAAAFYADVGDRPTNKHTIERIDNNGDYEPGNVRWATISEQVENTRQTHLLTLNGETMSLGKWARRMGMERATLRHRLKNGWSVEDAILTPVRRSQPA